MLIASQRKTDIVTRPILIVALHNSTALVATKDNRTIFLISLVMAMVMAMSMDLSGKLRE
jgi:hypothetical protein